MHQNLFFRSLKLTPKPFVFGFQFSQLHTQILRSLPLPRLAVAPQIRQVSRREGEVDLSNTSLAQRDVAIFEEGEECVAEIVDLLTGEGVIGGADPEAVGVAGLAFR